MSLVIRYTYILLEETSMNSFLLDLLIKDFHQIQEVLAIIFSNIFFCSFLSLWDPYYILIGTLDIVSRSLRLSFFFFHLFLSVLQSE